MIYMAADTEDPLPWAQDINELEAATHVEGVDVIVLVDPPEQGDSRLLKIVHDDNYFDPMIVSPELDDGGEVISGGGEVNTGSPATLRNFIVYSATHYPADNLVLVLWGHGGAWRGLCPDGYDLLTLPELSSALSMTNEALDRGIDMVVLDICNGATLEIAHEISGHADILVGSELLVPAEGLPYMDIVNDLTADTSQSVEAFAEVIVDDYIDWALYGSSCSTSMGAFDLGHIDDVVNSLDELSALGFGYDRLYHDLTSSAMRSSECTEEPWYLDLGSIAEEVCERDLPAEVKHAALLVAQSHQSAVIRHETVDVGGTNGIDTSLGLGVYVPADTALDEAYSELRIAETSWDEFSAALRGDRGIVPSGPGPAIEVGDSTTDGDLLPDVLTVTWSPDQSSNYSSYAVYVFQVWSHGLVIYSETHSETPIIRVAGVVGDLLISASAFIGDEVHSHHSLNATLSKLIGIEITVGQGGLVPGRQLEIVTHHEDEESHRVLCLSGSCIVYLVIPEQGDVGDIIRIEVVDADHETVLSERLIIITGEDIAITMFIHEPSSDSIGTVLAVSAVASLALLAIAFVIYANFLRGKKR
ncbi:MAG: clostripain-related cysteine peptidase [Candidatus Thermoplasmatota archaeon]|nr:clostripain-related cysteine peptidase [Candidatus Thermoplasmatota archaeon]